ncbi:unnamed protein product [[Actinomadura] parvosata subsp. kistnae]|nr:unnamed protein product [Actinomadura parvosata subsp. kistnae]
MTRELFVLDTQITPLAEELRPRLRALADEVNAVPLCAVA